MNWYWKRQLFSAFLSLAIVEKFSPQIYVGRTNADCTNADMCSSWDEFVAWRWKLLGVAECIMNETSFGAELRTSRIMGWSRNYDRIGIINSAWISQVSCNCKAYLVWLFWKQIRKQDSGPFCTMRLMYATRHGLGKVKATFHVPLNFKFRLG